MKKLVRLGIVLVGVFSFFSSTMRSEAAEIKEDIMTLARQNGAQIDDLFRPKSSILIDGKSGRVLFADQADTPRPIASLSKVMTAYLVFEAMEAGKFNLETQVIPSDKVVNIANIYALSNNKMYPGVSYTVEQLLYLLFIPSSNAATVMLSELVLENQEAGFVQLMNDKAASLGMTNTRYYNATGAQASAFNGYYLPEGIDPDGDNISTARDLSNLTYNFIKHYPEVLKYTSTPKYTVHPGTEFAEDFETYNISMEGAKFGLPGIDGLKTGSSNTAAYCLIATGERNGMRLIEVLLGSGSWELQLGEEERHPIANALLEKGFNDYEYRKVLAPGETKINDEEVNVAGDLFALVSKNDTTAPSFTLANDKVAFVSDLTLVSPLVEEATVAYTPVQQAVPVTEESKKGESFIKNQPKELLTLFQTYLLPLILALISVIVMMLSTFLKEKADTRRRARRQSILGRGLLILGSLGLLGAIGYALLILFNLA